MSEALGIDRTLPQRELRNQSARVLRAVAAGESFVVTNRGEAVARLVPIDEQEPRLPITRPASRIGGWSDLVDSHVTSFPSGRAQRALDDVRAERL
ncbi:type II toxin-antitoxin system prevent-host-death family antitoxin [Dermabacter vaginalis]|uniref:Antitoxin n=1 Tax=Dermabacter vaginalis TaxID=1630135 RepID=A0A1B0ZG85_9MICO|nr:MULTISPECIES: type II toxin-antitoxin system prevent-host-death family antitoxin [Dermabacter]ANP26950.1 hypothetical protein DAD186_03930 [Dermabacter vaginalis]MCG7444376.1 type II toxin-antitoxin system prevent-host-death family antitoxin [Dermabacter vaginalis]MCT2149451.1 type II toxin-antitoxin system prevent-host-death family antitoxin [Dermabacter vaginalis]QEU12504.1 type II toxin-antitoxin system prevent-host-death family antitoxin [Dermabacter vaginalis]RUP85795.1 type II toxin-a